MAFNLTVADFFKEYGLFVVLALIFLIVAIVAFLLIRNARHKNNQQNDLLESIVEALGGRDNIQNMEAKMSRLIVELSDDNLVDLDRLKQIGVARVIKMSNKMTLLIGNVAGEIADNFNK